MYVLKYFKFLVIQMPQQSTPVTSNPCQRYGRDLRADLSRLIRPRQMVGIDHVAAFGVNHKGL